MQVLAGKTAIVTGASAGIGKRVAERLAKEKMNLALVARSEDKLRILARELEQFDIRVLVFPADVTDLRAMQRMVELTAEEFGSIDVLVNNAGVDAFRDYHTLDVAEITNVIDVNLTASLVLTRMVLPHMLRNNQGHIVNMSSTAGKHGPAFGAAYGASKAGLIAFTESLRGEYHGSGISASVICPGFTHAGGIYDRIIEETGRETPAVMGATTGEAVAKSVVRAIQSDKPEIIVNNPPLRPMFVLAEALPSLAEWCIRKTTSRFFQRVAQAKQRS